MLDITTIAVTAALCALFSGVGYARLATIMLSAFDHVFGGAAYKEHRHKWLTLTALRREIGAVSAQDEFARWARLQRRVDTAQAEWDKSQQERSRGQMAGKMKASLGMRVVYAVGVAGLVWRWRGEEAVGVPIVWRFCGERAVRLFGIEMVQADGRMTVLLLLSIFMQGFARIVSVFF